MLTTIALVFLMVFLIRPESKLRLEAFMMRKTPRPHVATFRAIKWFHADADKRHPERRALEKPR